MLTFTDCKINIGLDIIRRRTDGYHDIETIMVPVPWHDVLEILPCKGDSATLTVLGNPVNCAPEDNLVMKAFRLLQREYDLPDVDIVLQKIVPDGAGLGGGSSDASNMLKLANDYFSLNLSLDKLASYAAKLGADCPIFIYDKPMFAFGTGTDLEPIDINLSGLTLLISKPNGVNISTKQAYANVHPSVPKQSLCELIQLPIMRWQGLIKNDFEPSIFPLAPKIEAVKDIMLEQGALYASMSGSGASVYGFFSDTDKAHEICDSILAANSNFIHVF